MKIYLVRHAQSEANADYSVLRKKTNIAVHLTHNGILQAQEAGKVLAQKLKEDSKIKIWNSPYNRTRQTSEKIKEALQQENISFVEEESIYISERQFGLLDDNAENRITHKKELEHYNLHKEFNHDFWARPPLGESPFDMCIRLDYFLRNILNEENYDTHVIVSHGAAVRGLITMKQKLPFEEYSKMANPPNGSIQLIDGNEYKGVIFSPTILTS